MGVLHAQPCDGNEPRGLLLPSAGLRGPGKSMQGPGSPSSQETRCAEKPVVFQVLL